MLEILDRNATSWRQEPFNLGSIRLNPTAESTITMADLREISNKLAREGRYPYMQRLGNSRDNAINASKKARKIGQFNYTQEMRVRQHNGLLHILAEQTERCDDEDPLVDIVCLLARLTNNFDEDDDPRAYIFCVQGTPKQRNLTDLYPYEKRQQFSDYNPPSHDPQQQRRKQYYTISHFNGCEELVLRALYLVNEVVGNDEEELQNTLQRYVEKTQTEQAGIGNVAIGLLELLNNTLLINNRQFKSLAHTLASIATKSEISLEEIRETTATIDPEGLYRKLYYKYHYRVMDNKRFWEGWLRKQKSQEETQLVVGRETFPILNNADTLIRKRNKTKSKLGSLNRYNALASNPSQSQEGRAKAIIERELEKKVLEQELMVLNNRIPESIRAEVRRYMMPVTPFRQNKQEAKAYSEYLQEAATTIIRHFHNNRELEKKMNLQSSAYALDADKLSKIESLQWLLRFKKEKKFREHIKALAHHNPHSFERWLRLNVYDIGRQCFATRQTEFLCSSLESYELRDTVAQTINQLEELAKKIKPNIWESLTEAQQSMLEWVKTQRDPQTQKSIRRHLRNLQRKGGIISRWVTINKQDIIRAVKSVAIINMVGFGLGFCIDTVSRNASEDIIDIRVEGENTVTPDITEEAERLKSREEIGEHKPGFLGRVLHMPSWLQKKSGDNFGYIPFSYEYYNPVIKETDPRVIYVPNIKQAQIEPTENQIVYQMAFFNTGKIVLPPLDYKFVKIITEPGNTKTIISQDGRYAVLHNQDPEKVIFIVEPKERIDISTRVWKYNGEKEVPYTIANFISEESLKNALDTNIFRFSGDPRLKELADQYVQELYQVATEDPENKEKQTEVIIKYIHLYAEYVDKYRFYALPNIDIPTYAAAKWMADNPDAGYSCQISAHAFQQLFNVMGVLVLNQAGVNASLIEDQLWSNTTPHLNNIVYLPNGEVIYVDMTPAIKQQTPQEDIDVLAPKKPNSFETAMQDILPIVKDYGIQGVTALLLLAATAYSVKTVIERKRRKRFENDMNTSNNDNSDDMKKAIREKVQNYINASKEFSSFEHNFVLAMAVKIATEQPTPDMIDEMVHTLQWFKDYNPAEDEGLLQWLVETSAGEEVLDIKDPKKGFIELAGRYYANKEGLGDRISQKWKEYLENIDLQAAEEDQEIPYDAEKIWQLAQIISEAVSGMNVTILILDIAQQLGVQTRSKLESEFVRVTEKANMMKEQLYNMYMEREMDPRTAAYLNAVHKVLSNMGASTSETEEAEIPQSIEGQTVQDETER